MEKIPLGSRTTCDDIHRTQKSGILLDQKSMEPGVTLMGTGVDKLQLQDSLPTGKLRRETRHLKETAGVAS